MKDKIIEILKEFRMQHGMANYFPEKYQQDLATRIASLSSGVVCECTEGEILKSDNGIYWCSRCGKYPVITASTAKTRNETPPKVGASEPAQISEVDIQRHIERDCRSEHGDIIMDEQAYYEGARWAIKHIKQ